MPNDKAHSHHASAKKTPEKRLIKAIRGGLTITDPKLGCVPTSDLAEAVIQTFPRAFLDACSAQMKLSPMINKIASEGKWIFHVAPEGLLGDRSITDYFSDLADRIRESQGGAIDDVKTKVTRHEIGTGNRESGRKQNPTVVESSPSNQIANSTESNFPISDALLELLKERLVRRHDFRATKDTATADFVSAVIASFPIEFLADCDKRLAENKQIKQRVALTGRDRRMSHRQSHAILVFDDAPFETLGGVTVAECFRLLVQRLTAQVKLRMEREQDRSAFVRQLYETKDLHGLKRTLPDGWRKDEVVKRIQLRSAAQRLEEEKKVFRREIQELSPDELRKLSAVTQPEWKRCVVKGRLEEILNEQKEQLQKFRIWLNGQGLRKLRLLLSSFDASWKNEEVKKLFEVKERREQEQLRIEEQRKHEREVKAFTESLNRKTAEELEQLKDSSLQGWMKAEATKRLTEIRILQRAQETEQLIATLNGNVVRILCEMAESHPHGWQSNLISDHIIDLLRKLGLDFIEKLSKVSGEGIQRVVDWATAEVESRQRAKELGELNTQLHGKNIEELASMVSWGGAAWQNDEIVRQIEKLLPHVDLEVLVRLRKSDFLRINELAQGELIRRRQKNEVVMPKKVEQWVSTRT